MNEIIIISVVAIVVVNLFITWMYPSEIPDPENRFKYQHEDFLQPDFIYIPWQDKKDYMASAEWRSIRRERLTKDGFTCTCGSKLELEVHHKTYERWRHEELSDLITLCRNCHQKIHDETGYSHNQEH